MDPVLDSFDLERAYEVVFDAEGCLRRYLYDSADSDVMRVPEYTGMSRGGTFVFAEVRVMFGTDSSRDDMRLDFVDALRRYKATNEDLHGILSLAKPIALEAARADTTGASKSGAPVSKVAEANLELSGSVFDENKDWDLEGMMTVEEVEKTVQCGQILELQYKFLDTHVKALKRMVEVFVLAKPSKDLERQLLKSYRALCIKQKVVKIVQVAGFTTRHSGLVGSDEAREYHTQLEDAEGRWGPVRDNHDRAQ